MREDITERVSADERFVTLVRRWGRLTWALTGLMLVAYFGFVLLVAFDNALIARPIGTGVTSLGIVIGFGLIPFAILLTGLYVHRANREFDGLVDALAADHGR